ncbi:MAG TPA: AAA family ATPase [Vicinamibacterales bacterium]|jgi:type II secretory pathway predicted ATPase ExeA
MYQRFYGLTELPFELTPNPKYLFLTPQHQEALSNLQYGLASSKGITALIGEAGTGKTTLLHAAAQSERCRDVVCVYLNNPTLTRAEFVEMLSQRFQLGPRAGESKAALLEELERVLLQRRSQGQITALVIDEAQSLSVELLEEIRLLANVETSTEKLLPLVLSGQPELRDRLNVSDLRQLKQRITLRCEIAPFTLQETAAYIATRIRISGGDAARLFTRDAVTLIHERSRGIPRTVSVLCDNALVTGFAMGRRPVDQEIVAEVAHDFDFGAPPPVSEPVALLTAEQPEAGETATDGESGANVAGPAPEAEQESQNETLSAGATRRRFSLFRGR